MERFCVISASLSKITSAILKLEKRNENKLLSTMLLLQKMFLSLMTELK